VGATSKSWPRGAWPRPSSGIGRGQCGNVDRTREREASGYGAKPRAVRQVAPQGQAGSHRAWRKQVRGQQRERVPGRVFLCSSQIILILVPILMYSCDFCTDCLYIFL
jgi:hypothetical protein